MLLYTGVRLRSNLEAGPLPPPEHDLGRVWVESQMAAVPEDPGGWLLLLRVCVVCVLGVLSVSRPSVGLSMTWRPAASFAQPLESHLGKRCCMIRQPVPLLNNMQTMSCLCGGARSRPLSCTCPPPTTSSRAGAIPLCLSPTPRQRPVSAARRCAAERLPCHPAAAACLHA